MSKSSLHHDRDGIAIDALRRILPTYWLFKDPADIYSKKEYSEDLIIEIINDDERRTVTGVEFGIQNKTEVKTYSGHVTVKLEVSDIERLMALQRPVIIHGYHMSSKTSYWVWLNEWYPKNHSKLKKRKRKSEVSIKIPKRNELNARAVEKIEAYVREYHRNNKLHDHISMVARAYKNDYQISLYTSDTANTIVVDPKHDDAVPNIRAIDKSVSDAMIQAIEIGKPVPLVGKFSISNFPELLHATMGATLESAWIIPLIDENRVSHLKIELYDDTDTIIVRSPLVEIREVQQGTLISKWQGRDKKNNIIYTLTFDKRANDTNLNIDPQLSENNAQGYCDYFDLRSRMRTLHKIRVTNLELEQSIERVFPNKFDMELTPQEELCHRLAQAIRTIETKLAITISLPKEFDAVLFNTAEWVAEVLTVGAVKANPKDVIPEGGFLKCGDSAQLARAILAEFDAHGRVTIILHSTTAEINVELLGQELKLGLARYAFGNVRIGNIEELRRILEDPNTTDDMSVETVYEVDRGEIYTLFEDWIPND